nr:hypothetical protein [Nocardioides alcanivorans]
MQADLGCDLSRTDLRQLGADGRIVDLAGTTRQLEELLEAATHAGLVGRIGALEAERGTGDLPPVARLPQAVGVRDPHVGEEHLVEAGAAGHLLDLTHLHPRCIHRHQEGGEARVLGHARVGAHQRLAPLGELRA